MTDFAWTFQGGRHLTITIGATAGNVVTNLTPALGKRWLILGGIVTIVCDATAVNRIIILTATDGTNITRPLSQTANILATTTKKSGFGEANYYSTGCNPATVDWYCGLGTPILLEGADQFRITINAGVAGDSYSGFIDILEVDV